MKKTLLIAATALLATAANAQYITKTPEGGFDVSKGKDYVVVFAPEDVVANMGDRVKSDQNLDPTMERNQFFYWVTDWDKTKLVLANVEEEGAKNSWGGETMINMTPLYEWGGGNFGPKGDNYYDFSMVQADLQDYILHIGLRDIGNATSQYRFSLGHFDSKATPKIDNGFMLEVNADLGSDNGGYVGCGSIGHDKQWYSLDIPLADIIDEDGQFGFEFDWSQAFPKGVGIFTVAFDKPTVTIATGTLMPGDEVETYTITQLGSALSLDAVFFYKKDSDDSAVRGIQTDLDTTQAVYDIAGRRTTMSRKGIYVLKTAEGFRKVKL